MSREWVATYRLQLRQEFPFAAAAEILPYLADLGISHVYLSPVLEAEPGSQHGYDGADPARISRDLGGEEGWAAFRAAAEEHGLGVLVDIVPNHLTVSASNPWWEDMLAGGPFSARAACFDIYGAETAAGWKVRLFSLEAAAPELLAAGRFTVDPSGDRPRLRLDGQSWPLAVHTWRHLIPSGGELAPVFEELRELSLKVKPGGEEIARWRALEQTVQGKWEIPHEPAAFPMDLLLAEQFYELHPWREASSGLNYRRFFAVNSLVGVRTEDPAVFTALHERVARMVREEGVDGLRVDHPDGLRDPAGYLKELARQFPDTPVYVEKILLQEESLPRDWPVAGTVGYDFLTRVNALWVDPEGLDELSRIHSDFTGGAEDYPAMVVEKKRMVVDSLFPRELDHLAGLAADVAAGEGNSASLTGEEFRAAIRELSVRIPVYRTYIDGGGVSAEDRRLLQDLFHAARSGAPAVRGEAFDLLERILLSGHPSETEREFIARWQQFTGPVAAKGVEDTTFYNYNRLIALNEVGGNPAPVGDPVAAFHAYCGRIARDWPRNLLLTASHDTKRGEDVRARLSVISELPGHWAENLERWGTENLEGWRGYPPDRNMEYYLYQTMAGAWPLEEERCREHMLKACREAAEKTTWLDPDADYERAVGDFIAWLYASEPFLAELRVFAARLAVRGRVNSLAQTLLKLTAPGVPDFYQGCELPEFSLVDPDNRRTVDFLHRRDLLAEISRAGEPPHPASPEAKLWVIHKTLKLRRARPEWFAPGAGYEPLEFIGEGRNGVVAFQSGTCLITAVRRLRPNARGSSALTLPTGLWRHEFTGETFEGNTDTERLFARFPVALLHQHPS